MDIDELKATLQAHFTDGLVLVVGSGLSCAEGLPGMQSLAATISSQAAGMVAERDKSTWEKLEPLIASKGLEPALFEVDISDGLQDLISTITADAVEKAEGAVLADVFAGQRDLRLSLLIPHLLKTQPAIPVITTNYDRLVEAAFEASGLGVDNMFVGDFMGQLNEKEAAYSQLRDVRIMSKKVHRTYRNHLRIAKPHGSLDWYYRNGVPVRCTTRVPGQQRLIIAPGKRKFRSGYDSPFDVQRERANRAIDGAARFLIVGYGFNDDHLETHLAPAIAAGKPTIILTRDLTPTAEEIALKNNNVIAIDRRDVDDRSRVIADATSHTVERNFWDLRNFVKEVFAA